MKKYADAIFFQPGFVPERHKSYDHRLKTAFAVFNRDSVAKYAPECEVTMPKRSDIKKVLVIGSGPIIIGQAAEFDYAGTQACRSLKEEGVEVVLINSNPATIMTDKDIADEVYIEPLTVDMVKRVILKEKPDSVLTTLGGQAGLNIGMELEECGFLKENNVNFEHRDDSQPSA